MSERIRGRYDDALYKSAYTLLLYFTQKRLKYVLMSFRKLSKRTYLALFYATIFINILTY